MPSERAYSDAEIDAALASLNDPERLRAAQDVVARRVPQIQGVLDEALATGGWFGSAHEGAVRKAAGEEDPGERLTAVRTLVAEETRIGMLVGVTVGFELARELYRTTEES